AEAAGDPGGGVIGQLPFAAQGTEQVLLFGVGAVLSVIAVGIRGIGKGTGRSYLRPWVVETILLIAQVGVHQKIVGLIIGGQRQRIQGAVFIFDRTFAVGGQAVDPDAPLFILTET